MPDQEKKMLILGKSTGRKTDTFRRYGDKREVGHLIPESDAWKYRTNKEYCVLDPDKINGKFAMPTPPEDYTDANFLAELEKRLGDVDKIAFASIRENIAKLLPSVLLARLFEFDDNNGLIPGILRDILIARNGNVHQMTAALTPTEFAIAAKTQGLDLIPEAELQKLETLVLLKVNHVTVKALLELHAKADGVLLGEHVIVPEDTSEQKKEVQPTIEEAIESVSEVKEINKRFVEPEGFDADALPNDLHEWENERLYLYAAVVGVSTRGNKTELIQRIYGHFNESVPEVKEDPEPEPEPEKETYPKDIETRSFHDIQAYAVSKGIPANGTKLRILKRIKEHFEMVTE